MRSLRTVVAVVTCGAVLGVLACASGEDASPSVKESGPGPRVEERSLAAPVMPLAPVRSLAACEPTHTTPPSTPVKEPFICPAEPTVAYVTNETFAVAPVAKTCAAASKHRKMFALTFDDGPNDPQTRHVMDYIEQLGISASFMVQCHSMYRTDKANVVDERAVVKETFARGHMIASHSYCHHNANFMTPDEIRADSHACDDHLADLLGVRPRIYRPPYVEHTPTSLDILQHELGYAVVTANVYAEDTRDYSSLAHTIDNYRKAFARKENSYISLMHDSICINHLALPSVIKTFSCAGYEFVTLDVCLGLDAPYKDGSTNVHRRHHPAATCAALADVPDLDTFRASLEGPGRLR